MSEISIIIPNYNTEKYLPRCLDSLITQTFKDIEIIVIDDGSKDNSVQIMKQYASKDSRIKIIEQQNAGPATARNKGLENATGKYLMFCDSDDWYEPNMCEVMYNTIEKEKTDIVCCHCFFEKEDGLPFYEKEKRQHEYYNTQYNGKLLSKENIIFNINVILWNKIWRRDLVEKYHIRFPEGHEHDDDAFWYMYGFMTNSIFCLKKPLYHYFLRSGSIMSNQVNNTPKDRMDRWAIANYLLDFFMKKGTSLPLIKIMPTIFIIQLQESCRFFNCSERDILCTKARKILTKTFGKKVALPYILHERYFLVQPRSKKKIFLQIIWHNFCYFFASFFNSEKSQIYDDRIRKDYIYLKLMKGKEES